MKKIKITFEIEIDEDEVAKIENYQDDYKGISVDEYIKGIELLPPDEYYDYARLLNPVEEHYNESIVDSRAIKSVKVIKE